MRDAPAAGAMQQPFHRLLIGRTLAGRYEVGDVIGSGGMSVVFRGMDRTLGRPVAVKVVALPSEPEELRVNLRDRFRREAGSAAQIPHHPNVVQIYDYGTDPELDLDFIVMELLPGRDLKEVLAVAPPRPEASVRILLEAARGLAAGHRAGIVHRDVKPANVFLTGDEGRESVRLLDFGIAKPLGPDGDDGLTTVGQLPHSPAYASPEQMQPGEPVTAASDVYQLGLIGYELLAGARPWTDAELQRIRAEGEELPLPETPRWAAVAPALRQVVARAVRTRPADRYPDAAEFAEALAAALRDEHTVMQPATAAHDATVALPPPPPPAPSAAPPLRHTTAVPAPRRRRRGAPVLLAVPLLLIVAGLLWALTRDGDDAERSAAAAPLDAAGDTAALAQLEEKFVRLQASVAEGLDRQAPPVDVDTDEGDAPESQAEREAREREAAAEIERVVLDLNRSWVTGDLDRHLSHYAPRLARYYNERGASRDFVRQDRLASMRKYGERNMTVLRQAVTFPAPDRARALVDKEWSFIGDDERWDGAERQELVLEKRDGRWLVVSERDSEVYRSERRRT
ncbi:MAG TPA: serine/threonine-protein kinase [Longimicrobiaceae bacterium]|nr:serine/threonine-protein kinase [Longimicrobiaceae bacterium]